MAVGINEQGIAKINAAFDEYRSAVWRGNILHADSVKMTAAIKGTETTKKVKTLTNQVQNLIDDSMKSIKNEFVDKTSQVVASYKNQDSSATSISNVVNQLKS